MKKQPQSQSRFLMIFLVATTLLYGALVIGMAYVANQPPPPQTFRMNNVKELREAITSCLKGDGWSPSIVTIWSAPPNRSYGRKPIGWDITCVPSPENTDENH